MDELDRDGAFIATRPEDVWKMTPMQRLSYANGHAALSDKEHERLFQEEVSRLNQPIRPSVPDAVHARVTQVLREKQDREDRLRPLIEAAKAIDENISKTGVFKRRLDALIDAHPKSYMSWADAEVKGMRALPGRHKEIVERYSALDPLRVAERCRGASGKQGNWLTRFFMRDAAAYYEEQVRPLVPELRKLLETLDKLIASSTCHTYDLGLDCLALQVFIPTIVEAHHRMMASQRLAVLMSLRASQVTLHVSLLNTHKLISSAITSITELLDVVIPNWGMVATNEIMAKTHGSPAAGTLGAAVGKQKSLDVEATAFGNSRVDRYRGLLLKSHNGLTLLHGPAEPVPQAAAPLNFSGLSRVRDTLDGSL